MIFPGCAARAALKANLEKGLKERWIIGSNDLQPPSFEADNRQAGKTGIFGFRSNLQPLSGGAVGVESADKPDFSVDAL